MIPAPATSGGTHTEDFTTTTFKDTVNTTADWNILGGELRPFGFSFSLAGSYSTSDRAYGVAVAGNHALVADANAGLQVIAISDPTNPTLAGGYDTPGLAHGVAVAGDHVFVADWDFGLQVIDISDPTAPFLAGSYDTPGSALAVALAGDHAYVADRDSGLVVIDISDPTTPTIAGAYSTPNIAYGIAVSGNFAFVADGTSGLQVIDIGDPTAPNVSGSYNTTGSARGVAVDGFYAYVADAASGLQVIDISNPNAPTLAGTYDTPSFAYRVAVAGDRVYVADHSAGLLVVDVSNPAIPMLIDSYDTAGSARDIAVAGDYAYVGDHSAGLAVIDVLEPTALPLSGSYLTSGYALDVAVAGDYAYVGNLTDGLQVIDISDPAVPTQVGNYVTPEAIYGVTVVGYLAYVAAREFGLYVIDISDPTNPTLFGSHPTTDRALDLDVAGDHAYIANDDFLYVVDISNPAAPTMAFAYDIPGVTTSVNAVAVAGDHAYVAESAGGLWVIDVSDPTNPILAGSQFIPGAANGVAIAGDHAYVTDVDSLLVVDISDPTNMGIVGRYDAPNNAWDVVVAGDYAFIAEDLLGLPGLPSLSGGSGLHVLDISDPTNPTLARIHKTPGAAYGVTVAGDHVYVADFEFGLQVIQVFQSETHVGVGQSLPFGNGDLVPHARVSSTETPSVAWQLSADGGASFDSVAVGEWNAFTTPGPDVVWRSTLDWASPGGPVVSEVTIEWLNEYATIATVSDIPNDQGNQVSVEWTRSGRDFVGDPMQIVEYGVYRRIDPNLATVTVKSKKPFDGLSHTAREHAVAMQTAGWHFITTVPVRAEDEYAVVAPTLADSTVVGGQYYTTFMVTAFTATPGVFFDSPPDSGYSLDNLAPFTPSSFVISYNTGGGNTLAWDDPVDADFEHFSVYRSTDPDFAPGPSDRVHTTTSTSWTDPEYDGWPVHYKVTATDASGNESDPATTTTATSVPDVVIPSRHALYQNVPNPFNPTTTIRYDVARGGGLVTLRIFDVSGRLVRTLVDAKESGGQKSVDWDGRNGGGAKVATGTYFYRLTAPGFTQTKKMVLLK